jgi:hypothetical protein
MSVIVGFRVRSAFAPCLRLAGDETSEAMAARPNIPNAKLRARVVLRGAHNRARRHYRHFAHIIKSRMLIIKEVFVRRFTR